MTMSDITARTGLDDMDMAVLAALQSDASVTAAELARQMNLSQPAMHNRIRRLRERGYIQRITALLDRELLGLDLMCFIHVAMQAHHRDRIGVFQAAVATMPEVLECHHVTGEFDFLLKVVVTHRKALEELLVQRLSTIEGVVKIQTSMVLSEVKSTTDLPLE
jgi:Lrp/AsnC family transcriptional regulator, leucine-responsive regulatory protein